MELIESNNQLLCFTWQNRRNEIQTKGQNLQKLLDVKTY